MQKKILKQGILIALEGIDGSGKSSLAKNLADYFKQFFTIVLTKEPGGSPLGAKLREIIQKEKVSSIAEFLLFAADRAEHFEQIIIPALQQQKLIISDRMADSSLAYQGYARGLDVGIIALINNWAMQDREPDLIIYTKIDVNTTRERLKERRTEFTVFEQEKEQFMQTVADAYDTIYKTKTNVLIIDAQQSLEKMTQDTIQAVEQWMNQKKIILP